MDNRQTSTAISKAIVEYYSLEINERMPSVIVPREDPNLVCCVMDRVKGGRFLTNVVYGKGEYFNQNVGVIEQTMRRSTVFKELPGKNEESPKFSYIGSRK